MTTLLRQIAIVCVVDPEKVYYKGTGEHTVLKDVICTGNLHNTVNIYVFKQGHRNRFMVVYLSFGTVTYDRLIIVQTIHFQVYNYKET